MSAQRNMLQKDRYENLDGFRTLGCLCIIAMHIRANSRFQITGWIFNILVPAWTHFVPLFLMISGFGMFCGYYQRFLTGNYQLETFYSRRYRKILPFFSLLILIDVLITHTLSHVAEGLMEMSLVFGLLPNNRLSVIGVSWTIGVIFLFYMLFPFFVYLCRTGKHAFFALFCSMGLSLLCSGYFFSDIFVKKFIPRHHFLYCAPFFLAGGCIYLYRNQISGFVNRHKAAWLVLTIVSTAIYLMTPWYLAELDISMLKNLCLFSIWMGFGIGECNVILNNRATAFFSGISLEVYLVQMVVFRAIEKLHLLYRFGKGWSGFAAAWIMVTAGSVVFVKIYRFLAGKAAERFEK